MDVVCQRCGREMELDPSLFLAEEGNPFTPGVKDSRTARSQNPPRPAFLASSTMVQENEDSSRAREGGESAMTDKSKSYSGPQVQRLAQAASEADTRRRPKGAVSHVQMAAAQKLFRMAIEMTDIDFPMCSDCIDVLFDEYEAMGKREAKEASAHQEFLAHFQQTMSISMTEDELSQQIRHLEEEEKKLMQILHDVEQERVSTNAQMEAIQFENKKLDLLEEKYWTEYNKFMTESAEFEEKSESLQAKLSVATKHLEKLQRTDVYNDVFHIWHDGHFGTINELRLGRLPSQPVEWSEINAAWGQACHLLYCLANKLQFRFTGMKLIPQGSFSRVEWDGTQYELYGSNDLSIGRILRDRRFDTAMVGFLRCLKEICDYVKNMDPTFVVPYEIEKEKIGGAGIKTNFNNDVVWTKALKHTLIDLKWLLAWITKHDEK